MSIPEICEGKPAAGSLDESGYHFTRNWTVIAASEIDALKKLKAAMGIDRGALFQNSQGQVPDSSVYLQRFPRVEGRPPAPKGGMGLYYIEAEYASTYAPLQPVPGGPAVWAIRTSLANELVDHDVDGYPIVMSSEEPVDPPLTRLRPEEVLHGEFYIRAASALKAYFPLRPYNCTLNLTPFLGAPKGCVLCHPFQCEDSDTGWIKTAVDFQYKPKRILFGQTYQGWTDSLVDRGRRKIIDAKATDPVKRYAKIVDSKNEPVDEPVFLNGKGQPLLPVTNIVTDGKNPTIIPVHHYTYMDFNQIPGLRIR
jgi:hypothetical protein